MNLCRYLMAGTGCVHAKASKAFTGPQSCVDCKWYAGSHRGLGDVVASVVSAVGVDRIVGAVEHLTNRDCGCGQRRAALNAAVPFVDKTTDVQTPNLTDRGDSVAAQPADAADIGRDAILSERHDGSEAGI